MVTHINTLNMISSTVLGIRIHCYAWHTAKNELSKRGNLVATLGSTLYSVSGIGMLSITSGPSICYENISETVYTTHSPTHSLAQYYPQLPVSCLDYRVSIAVISSIHSS